VFGADVFLDLNEALENKVLFPSAISYFKICAGMNQSLIPPFTGFCQCGVLMGK
jgi:hypothetical protein